MKLILAWVLLVIVIGICQGAKEATIPLPTTTLRPSTTTSERPAFLTRERKKSPMFPKINRKFVLKDNDQPMPKPSAPRPMNPLIQKMKTRPVINRQYNNSSTVKRMSEPRPRPMRPLNIIDSFERANRISVEKTTKANTPKRPLMKPASQLLLEPRPKRRVIYEDNENRPSAVESQNRYETNYMFSGTDKDSNSRVDHLYENIHS